jgi:VWFA-related protein
MRFLRLALLLALAFRGIPQEARFSSEVKVVSLLATVHDRTGAVVKDLTKEDFRLEEDGRRQTIRYFARESDLPLTVVLLVDTSRSMRTIFEPVRRGSNRFLEQVLREDRDLAAVVHFDVQVETLQAFTSSRQKLAAALEELEIPPRPATLLYDAVRDTSENLMRKQPGRKAFILLSDGMDVRSQTSLGTAIEYAQRADTLIYSIFFTHPGMGGGAGRRAGLLRAAVRPGIKRGTEVMTRLARETGGGFYAVGKDNPIQAIYRQIEDELRNQYSVGYTPDRPAADGKYRKLKLTTIKKGLTVRTRDGYYPE